MQITIDTASLMGDETTIRDEVIDIVANNLTKALKATADKELKEILDSTIKNVVTATVEKIVATHIDSEIQPVSEYGRKAEATTIRGIIADNLEKQCVFQKKTYSSENNAFTSVIIKTVEDEMAKFKKEYLSQVNHLLVKGCLDEATKKLKEACGLS